MELLKFIIDFILHIDDHLVEITANYGLWIYAIIFLIVFCETGLVVTPFLPGDSLLFATGAIIALPESGLSYWIMYGVIFVAAVIGDATNYHIGRYIGSGIFKSESRFIKREYLEKTQKFYEKHGGKAIVYARFVPIIRTFAPFVAGVGTMDYKRFFNFNVFGAFLWVSLFLTAGYLFGNIQFIKDNFSAVILGIIILSLLPIFIEYFKARKSS
ncbi:MAG: DedA family protein [Bacteroidota bacterium]|jgi:membrane-associated protein